MIKNLELEMVNSNKVLDSELTHEGFTIDTETISSLSKKMSSLNASVLKMYFTNSSKILGRDFMLVMLDPKELTRIQRLILWLFRKGF